MPLMRSGQSETSALDCNNKATSTSIKSLFFFAGKKNDIVQLVIGLGRGGGAIRFCIQYM